jgi:hypothetical protein
MDAYLKMCDDLVTGFVERCNDWRKGCSIKEQKMKLFGHLRIFLLYDLEHTKAAAEEAIGDILELFCWGLTVQPSLMCLLFKSSLGFRAYYTTKEASSCKEATMA